MPYSIALSDPSGSSALTAATHWLEATLLGTIATTVAVICVAWTGVMMLNGRIHFRHGITTILGCFILFGATSIAAGIRCAAQGQCGAAAATTTQADPAASPFPEVMRKPLPDTAPADPYAGAAIRRR